MPDRFPRLTRDRRVHSRSDGAAIGAVAALRRAITRSRVADGESSQLTSAHVALSTLEAPDTRERPSRTPNPTVQAREGELEAHLTDDLTVTANRRAYLTDRPPPELRALLDGSYRYAGPLLGATIHRDGRVEFDDRPDVGTSFSPTDIGVAVVGSFDLTSLIMKAAGEDPLRAERAWFMRETRDLRERLMAERDRDAQAHALSALRRRLRSIRSSSIPIRIKRRQYFQLWDQAAEDEIGDRARARILEFVRRVLPAGSPEAFSAVELWELNAARESRSRFEPYRPSIAPEQHEE